MQYISTRGGVPAASYSEIILQGLARDGGLFVPKTYPKVDADTLESWRGLNYAQLATAVLSLFARDMNRSTIARLCEETYTEATYSHGRKVTDFKKITPVVWLEDKLGILELSNGPTLAFKDMAMQFLGALFEAVLEKKESELNILGATSGDTGSAAEYAMKGRSRIRVFMLSPAGRMSAFQKAQMYSLEDSNIYNFAVKGNFDDCQDIVKEVSGDLEFKESQHIGAVNSINWARIAAQVVYYFSGWLQAAGKGEKISFAVPSGNFGDVLAGWIAKQMGLPVDKLIVATNENDVLYEFFRTGRYRIRSAAETFVTSSPSMDISKASNFERYIFDIVGRDSARVVELWDSLKRTGEFMLTSDEWQRVKESGFYAARSTHADRIACIRDVWDKYRFVVDPHTADGINAARAFAGEGKILCLETALAAKFSETIEEALGFAPEIPAGYEGLLDRPQKVTEIPADTKLVKELIKEAAR
jgi:threonine synthase